MAVIHSSRVAAPDWAFDLLASFDRFVPAGFTDPAERRRSQLIVLFSAVGAITGCVLALVAPLLGLGWSHVVAFFSIALLAALVPIILRTTRSTNIGAHLFSLAWMGSVCIGMYTRGGVDNVAAPCLAPLPLIATILGGRRAGFIWLGNCCIAIVGFWLAPRFGFPLRDQMPLEFQPTYAFVTIITLLMMLVLFATAYVALEVASTRTVDAAVKEQQAAKNEAQMLRAGRLAALGEVAASLAHEINNPLMYLMANLEFLLEGEIAEDAREAAVDAHEGAGRIASIVRDLKAYASSDEKVIEPVDLAVVAQSTARLVHGFLRKRAQLELELGPCPSVEGNWAQLSQAVINVVVNAAQAAHPDKLATNCVTLRTGTDGDRVFLEVEDNGRGISAEDISRVTDPFYTTDHGGSGTGLGLQVTKNIVETFGGSLAIESVIGEGTVVRLSFGRMKTHEVLHLAPGDRRLRVLLIDRDPLVGAALRRMLAEHELEVAESTIEATSMLDDGASPDLILLDTGVETTEALAWAQTLRSERPSLALRVVFLTAATSLATMPEELAVAAERVVLKPLDRERLRTLIDARAGVTSANPSP